MLITGPARPTAEEGEGLPWTATSKDIGSKRCEEAIERPLESVDAVLLVRMSAVAIEV